MDVSNDEEQQQLPKKFKTVALGWWNKDRFGKEYIKVHVLEAIPAGEKIFLWPSKYHSKPNDPDFIYRVDANLDPNELHPESIVL